MKKTVKLMQFTKANITNSCIQKNGMIRAVMYGEKMLRKLIFVAPLLISFSVYADHGRTSSAIPTVINTVESSGFIIYGDFGNPGGCTNANSIWISKTHAQYDQLYSVALSALMAGKKVNGYIHSCISIPWLSGNTKDYNTITAGDFIINSQ